MSSTVYGQAADLVDRGETHGHGEHDYRPWRPAPGSPVSGAWCPGCGDLQID